MTKPVYIINGFLESGKTEFITFTLGQPYFQIKGRTLLILCEEGENEYDPALLKKSRTDVVLIEEEEEFNPNHLIELEKQYKPARIIIEYNGMWNFKNMKLPWYWKVEQQITTIDGSTFPMYYTNMKSLLADLMIYPLTVHLSVSGHPVTFPNPMDTQSPRNMISLRSGQFSAMSGPPVLIIKSSNLRVFSDGMS